MTARHMSKGETICHVDSTSRRDGCTPRLTSTDPHANAVMTSALQAKRRYHSRRGQGLRGPFLSQSRLISDSATTTNPMNRVVSAAVSMLSW